MSGYSTIDKAFKLITPKVITAYSTYIRFLMRLIITNVFDYFFLKVLWKIDLCHLLLCILI